MNKQANDNDGSQNLKTARSRICDVRRAQTVETLMKSFLQEGEEEEPGGKEKEGERHSSSLSDQQDVDLQYFDERLKDALRLGDDDLSDSEDESQEDDEDGLEVHYPEATGLFSTIGTDIQTEIELRCGMIEEIAEDLLGLKLTPVCQDLVGKMVEREMRQGLQVSFAASRGNPTAVKPGPNREAVEESLFRKVRTFLVALWERLSYQQFEETTSVASPAVKANPFKYNCKKLCLELLLEQDPSPRQAQLLKELNGRDEAGAVQLLGRIRTGLESGPNHTSMFSVGPEGELKLLRKLPAI